MSLLTFSRIRATLSAQPAIAAYIRTVILSLSIIYREEPLSNNTFKGSVVSQVAAI